MKKYNKDVHQQENSNDHDKIRRTIAKNQRNIPLSVGQKGAKNVRLRRNRKTEIRQTKPKPAENQTVKRLKANKTARKWTTVRQGK